MSEKDDEMIEQLKSRDQQWLVKMTEAFRDYISTLSDNEKEMEEHAAAVSDMKKDLLEQMNRVDPAVAEPPRSIMTTQRQTSAGSSTTLPAHLKKEAKQENITGQATPNQSLEYPSTAFEHVEKTKATAQASPVPVKTPPRYSIGFSSPIITSTSRKYKKASAPTFGANKLKMQMLDERASFQKVKNPLAHGMSPIIHTKKTIAFANEAKKVMNRESISDMMRERIRQLQASDEQVKAASDEYRQRRARQKELDRKRLAEFTLRRSGRIRNRSIVPPIKPSSAHSIMQELINEAIYATGQKLGMSGKRKRIGSSSTSTSSSSAMPTSVRKPPRKQFKQ